MFDNQMLLFRSMQMPHEAFAVLIIGNIFSDCQNIEIFDLLEHSGMAVRSA